MESRMTCDYVRQRNKNKADWLTIYKKIFKTPLRPEICLTPSRQARRRIVGFAIPGVDMSYNNNRYWDQTDLECYHEEFYGDTWHQPPFPRPFPPFPRPDIVKYKVVEGIECSRTCLLMNSGIVECIPHRKWSNSSLAGNRKCEEHSVHIWRSKCTIEKGPKTRQIELVHWHGSASDRWYGFGP